MMPHVTETLKRSLESWRDQVGAQMPTANPGYDPTEPAPKAAKKKAAATPSGGAASVTPTN